MTARVISFCGNDLSVEGSKIEGIEGLKSDEREIEMIANNYL